MVTINYVNIDIAVFNIDVMELGSQTDKTDFVLIMIFGCLMHFVKILLPMAALVFSSVPEFNGFH